MVALNREPGRNDFQRRQCSYSGTEYHKVGHQLHVGYADWWSRAREVRQKPAAQWAKEQDYDADVDAFGGEKSWGQIENPRPTALSGSK